MNNKFNQINNLFKQLSNNHNINDSNNYFNKMTTVLPKNKNSLLIVLAGNALKDRYTKDFEGYGNIQNFMNKFGNVLLKEYPEIYTEYDNLLNEENKDGRHVRDMDNNYRSLLTTGTTLIDFNKDLTSKQRTLLLKLFTYSNIKYIVNKDLENLLD